VHEFEEAICVSFHVITFGGDVGERQADAEPKSADGLSAVVYTPKEHGQK